MRNEQHDCRTLILLPWQVSLAEVSAQALGKVWREAMKDVRIDMLSTMRAVQSFATFLATSVSVGNF